MYVAVNRILGGLPPPGHAHPSVVTKLLQASEGPATVLTAEDSQVLAVLGLMLCHIA